MKNKPNIIIAEDDLILREAYTRKFARTPFKVRTAENGEEAIRMIRESPPDLLICDILMPKCDGWSVLAQLPKGKRTFPILMLTNMEDEETQKRIKEHCVDAYLIKKNMSLHSLVEKTKELLQKHPS